MFGVQKEKFYVVKRKKDGRILDLRESEWHRIKSGEGNRAKNFELLDTVDFSNYKVVKEPPYKERAQRRLHNEKTKNRNNTG